MKLIEKIRRRSAGLRGWNGKRSEGWKFHHRAERCRCEARRQKCLHSDNPQAFRSPLGALGRLIFSVLKCYIGVNSLNIICCSSKSP